MPTPVGCSGSSAKFVSQGCPLSLYWSKGAHRVVNREKLVVFPCLVLLLSGALAQRPNSGVTVSSQPDFPLIEHRDCRQLLNFDLTVSNHGLSTLRLAEIQLSIFDSAD